MGRGVRMASGAMAVGLAFAGLAGLAACGNDDDNGSGGIDTTIAVTTPDLDPGAGSGLPGDSGDETGGTGITDTSLSVDLDPGAGSGLPGDSSDETTVPGASTSG